MGLKERGMVLLGITFWTTKAKASQILSDKDVQATVASAAGGAVVLGTGGAATGLVAGGAIGGVLGVVPAIFTFGLSIPCFAVIGSGVGVVAGTALGSTTGVAAGVGSYRAYTQREAIRRSVGTMTESAFSSVRGLRARLARPAQ